MLQRGNAVRDVLRRKRGRRASGTACDAERRTIVDINHRSLRSSVAMQFATFCVAKEDAERPERRATRSGAR
ncbi:hypothetical protein GIW33_26700 [Pseudomonas syringae]|nr:hypothetical protein [Pseudomonas syringae]